MLSRTKVVLNSGIVILPSEKIDGPAMATVKLETDTVTLWQVDELHPLGL